MRIGLIFVLISIYYVFGDQVLVEIEEGWLSGTKEEFLTKDGTYYSFKGIPYAQAPVGPLRFKDPLPPSQWKGVRNASKHGAICTQTDIVTNEYQGGKEDCLFLNVYTRIITNSLSPVMVFIHGGGYKVGSGNEDSYGPDFLVRKGVVLVTINYRLGVLGFLCLNTKDVPGNAGLKDQVAALKWIKINIHKFGGDGNNVTIFGQSAGGASVGYHTISPASKGYFQRAIVMSGTPYHDWSLPYKPMRHAFILGQILGYQTKNTTGLLSFLQSVPCDKLVQAKPTVLASEEVTDILLKAYDFSPVYEKNHGQDIFLSEEPVKLLNSEKVNEIDLLFGYTDAEMLIYLPLFEKSLLAVYNRYSEMLVPRKILTKCNSNTILHISDKIHRYYFKNQSIDKTTMQEMIHYTSNSSIVYDLQRYFNAFPNPGHNTRYFYKFSCFSKRNINATVGAKYGIYGAAHTEDLVYLFNPKAFNLSLEKNTKEYKMVELVTTLFTNFAKYGNPTPDLSLGVMWPQFNNKTLAYANINSTLTMSSAADEADIQFWKKILCYAGIRF